MRPTRTLMALWCCAMALLADGRPALARDPAVVVGINVVNPMRMSADQQDAVVTALKAAGVKVIRDGITPDDKGIAFAKHITAQGMKIELILSPIYPPNAPSRPYQPDAFPQMWGGHPLSYADPALSRAYYETLIGKLEAEGIVLAGLELGNEINWAAFNAEFPLPGEGRVHGVRDLADDPEGRQIAKGYLQYLKVLAALKDVRDHARLNRTTPIILAGLVTAGEGSKLFNNKREDMVSLPATIGFLRAHGLDSLVDVYGIHTYPSTDLPLDRQAAERAAERRSDRFFNVDMAECRPAGSGGGKPCWITEWGFPNKDQSCPPDDTARVRLVRELRADFQRAAADGRLTGILYFSWNSEPWSKQIDADSVYRCGELTQSGREAIRPLRP
jgi:hypothetical protein